MLEMIMQDLIASINLGVTDVLLGLAAVFAVGIPLLMADVAIEKYKKQLKLEKDIKRQKGRDAYRRKVRSFSRAEASYDAYVNGRKAGQSYEDFSREYGLTGGRKRSNSRNRRRGSRFIE